MAEYQALYINAVFTGPCFCSYQDFAALVLATDFPRTPEMGKNSLVGQFGLCHLVGYWLDLVLHFAMHPSKLLLETYVSSVEDQATVADFRTM